MSDDASNDKRLAEFLDAVAARQATPGGGSVSAAVGALGCALGRMVAAYSASQANADESDAVEVTTIDGCLARADLLLRKLLVEDEQAYEVLRAAGQRLKDDPSSVSQHRRALQIAMAVPMQISATAGESLHLLERLLPKANRYLVSDLGVAAVLAEATVRAAAYMVSVNAKALDDSKARQEADHEIDQHVRRARESLERIEAGLKDIL